MTDLDQFTPGAKDADLGRRSMLRGAAVGGLALPLLAACGGGDDSAGGPSGDPGSAGGTSVAAADVPVGGG